MESRGVFRGIADTLREPHPKYIFRHSGIHRRLRQSISEIYDILGMRLAYMNVLGSLLGNSFADAGKLLHHMSDEYTSIVGIIPYMAISRRKKEKTLDEEREEALRLFAQMNNGASQQDSVESKET